MPGRKLCHFEPRLRGSGVSSSSPPPRGDGDSTAAGAAYLLRTAVARARRASGAAGKACVGVFHVAGGLLVAHGYEIDAGGRKEVQHIHKGGTENAAYMVYAFLNQYFCHRFTRGHLGHWGFPPNIIIGCRASLPDALSQQGGRAALLRTDSLGMYQLVPSMHKAFLFDNIMDSSKFMAFAPLQSAKMMRY